jgi:hypothetical protein
MCFASFGLVVLHDVVLCVVCTADIKSGDRVIPGATLGIQDSDITLLRRAEFAVVSIWVGLSDVLNQLICYLYTLCELLSRYDRNNVFSQLQFRACMKVITSQCVALTPYLAVNNRSGFWYLQNASQNCITLHTIIREAR